jgi:hypothetical protein
MKRSIIIVGGALALVFLLAGGAFMAGRLLSVGLETRGSGDGPKVKIAAGNGQAVEAEWVPAKEHPAEAPRVAGAFVRRQDNSLFVNETEGGFVIARNDAGSFSVTNATGQIDEVVVTGETVIYVDATHDNMGAAVSDGKLYQKLKAGSIEEIGDLSYVRAWGEMRGDRLIASVLVYTRPPVISR